MPTIISLFNWSVTSKHQVHSLAYSYAAYSRYCEVCIPMKFSPAPVSYRKKFTFISYCFQQQVTFKAIRPAPSMHTCRQFLTPTHLHRHVHKCITACGEWASKMDTLEERKPTFFTHCFLVTWVGDSTTECWICRHQVCNNRDSDFFSSLVDSL
jgi:hypothetical protein